MKYRLQLRWNDDIVLDGRCTLVTGTEAARSFFAGNFAGPLARPFVDNEFRLQRISDILDATGSAHGGWDDSTGRGRYSLWRE